MRAGEGSSVPGQMGERRMPAARCGAACSTQRLVACPCLDPSPFPIQTVMASPLLACPVRCCYPSGRFEQPCSWLRCCGPSFQPIRRRCNWRISNAGGISKLGVGRAPAFERRQCHGESPYLTMRGRFMRMNSRGRSVRMNSCGRSMRMIDRGSSMRMTSQGFPAKRHPRWSGIRGTSGIWDKMRSLGRLQALCRTFAVVA